MGLELELQFNAEDLKTILTTEAKKILITVKTAPSTDLKYVELKVYAAAFDSVGVRTTIEPVPGCPTPCHPNGNAVDCEEKAQQLISNYKNRSDFF